VAFAFGGILNALGMVKPIYGLEQWLSRAMGGASEGWVLGLIFAAGLCAVPFVLLGGAAAATRLAARDMRPIGQIAVRYAYSLIPFGFGVWLAHYGFHLLTGVLTIVPVSQSAVVDLIGWAALGEPKWRLTGMRPGAVFPIQLGLILLGTVGSLAVAYHISEREYLDRPSASTAPWAIVIVALASIAVWILSQPMEMRGIGFIG
jgi:hypothetical protein